MEDNESIKEVVVFLDAGSHGVPVMSRDGARVQEGVELDDSIANMTFIGSWRSAETVNLNLFAVANSRECD